MTLPPSFGLVRGGEEEDLFEGGDAFADAVEGDHAEGCIPWPMAILPISRVLARAMMSLRISSETVMASMMARRPE